MKPTTESTDSNRIMQLQKALEILKELLGVDNPRMLQKINEIRLHVEQRSAADLRSDFKKCDPLLMSQLRQLIQIQNDLASLRKQDPDVQAEKSGIVKARFIALVKQIREPNIKSLKRVTPEVISVTIAEKKEDAIHQIGFYAIGRSERIKRHQDEEHQENSNKRLCRDAESSLAATGSHTEELHQQTQPTSI